MIRLIEDQIDNIDNVELMLGFMLRFVNLCFYANPTTVEIEPEELLKAILKIDKDAILFQLGKVAENYPKHHSVLALIREVTKAIEDLFLMSQNRFEANNKI